MIEELKYTLVRPTKKTQSFMEFAKNIYPELKKNVAMWIAFEDMLRCEQRNGIIMEQSKPFMKMFNKVYNKYKEALEAE